MGRACLAQKFSDGEHPIAYAAHKLSTTQHNSATIEKEAFAIIFALKKFDDIVHGRKIAVYSDDNPLKFLSDAVPKSSKLTRWSLALQRYDITILHRSGVNNQMQTHCPGFSRLSSLNFDQSAHFSRLLCSIMLIIYCTYLIVTLRSVHCILPIILHPHQLYCLTDMACNQRRNPHAMKILMQFTWFL